MSTHLAAEQHVSILTERLGRLRQRLRRLTRPAWLGTLRRTTPLSDTWGNDRGTPIDRYYIECFLEAHRRDIRGRVLEVKDSGYITRFGSGVERADVLDIDPANPAATIVADLSAAGAIAPDQFDCFVLTQTLQFIYDVRASIRYVHRLLRPGGVALVTVPCASRLAHTYHTQSDYWRFTPASCAMLFGDVFGPEQTTVYSYGNVLAMIAFLAGMAHQELSRAELETRDPLYPIIVAVRATKKTTGDSLP